MDNDEDVSVFLEEARLALQHYVQESWLQFALCVAAGMTFQLLGSWTTVTDAELSQSEQPVESQPAARQLGAQTFDELSCHFNELQQVQVGTLLKAEFDRRRTSEVAASQRTSVARSPSVAAQPSPTTQAPAPHSPSEPARQRAADAGSSSGTAQLSPSTCALTVPATVSPAAASLTDPSPSLLPLWQVQPAPSDSLASATLSVVPTTSAAPDQSSPAGHPVRQAAMLAAATLALVCISLFNFDLASAYSYQGSSLDAPTGSKCSRSLDPEASKKLVFIKVSHLTILNISAMLTNPQCDTCHDAKVQCKEGEDPIRPCVRCTEKSLECIRESACVENIWVKKMLPTCAAKSMKPVASTSGKAMTKPGKSSLASSKQSYWNKHSIFDTPGPAFELLMGGSKTRSDSNVAATCLFWHAEVVQTGAAEEVARKAHEFALKMCTEAFTRALARKGDDTRPCKRSQTTKGKLKARVDSQDDAMDEDEVIVLDAEVGDWCGRTVGYLSDNRGPLGRFFIVLSHRVAFSLNTIGLVCSTTCDLNLIPAYWSKSVYKPNTSLDTV